MRIRVRSLLLAGLGLVVLLVLALITLRGGGWIMPIPELGTLPAPNLTPDVETGLGAWSDDEIARAIQEGVSRDGRALFPIMPYMNFRHLDDEDLASIVVYLRTLPAVRNELPERQLIFPLSLLVNTMPEPLTGPAAAPAPARVTAEARGEYLVRTVIGCQDCHTPMDSQGQPLPGMALAGGGAVQRSRPGPAGLQQEHHAGRLRHRALRRGHVLPDDADGTGRRQSAQPYHAVRELPASDRRRHARDLFVPADGAARTAPREQHRPADPVSAS